MRLGWKSLSSSPEIACGELITPEPTPEARMAELPSNVVALIIMVLRFTI
jgi:hypothetical protein